jgi:Tol biopolymer transport system component
MILNGRLIAIALLLGLTGCQDSGLITPPPQSVGATLNSTAADQQPHFSYDGRYLVFVSDRSAQREILLYDQTQNRLIPLPGLNQTGIFQDQPDLSADGRYIVYVSEQSGKPDVWLYDRQTFQSKNLTQNQSGEFRHPTISGDGRFIAFETNYSGQWNISIYDQGTKIEVSQPLN